MSFIIRKILKYSMYLFYTAVKPYSMFISLNSTSQKLPPIKNDLLRIPGVRLAEMIRQKEVKCEAVIQAYVDRCKEVDPMLNAIVEDRFEEALEQARLIDQEIESGIRSVEEMKTNTPLLGLPLTVKESIMVQGMSNTSGRFYKKKNMATEDAPIVKNAKRNGAVILCVTSTPELCLFWETYNKVHGLTKNPYDVKRTPGGSSGGEAALLGAGASLLSLGSDIAGSCRLPAMFVGVYGHKPTPFVCSPFGHNPQSEDPRWGTFFTTAPLTRYAADLVLLLDAVKENDGPELHLRSEVDVHKLKYFVMTNDQSGMTNPLSPCIKKSLMKIANHFNAKKVKISKMKWTLDTTVCAILPMEFDSIYTKTEEGRKQKTTGKELLKYCTGQSESNLSSVVISILQSVAKSIPESRQRQLEGIRRELKAEILKMLGDKGILLYPTFPTSANKHYEMHYKLLDPVYLMIFNTLGLPVTQVHTGYDKNKLPIGIQVVTAPGNDHLSIAVAREIEKEFTGWIPADELSTRRTRF